MKFDFLKTTLKTILSLALISIIFIQCGSDSNDPLPPKPNPEEPKPPTTEITPAPGMDLYGVILDNKGTPVPNVVVTDGYSCTKTNAKGIYQMKRNDKATFVYYSTPSKYEINTTSSKTKVASFYSKLTTNEKRYDFELKELAAIEKEFTFIAVGDPQVTNVADTKRFEDETMADLKKFISSQTKPCYGIALGDVTGDKPAYNERMKTLMGSTDMIMHVAIGNHDKVAFPDDPEKPRNTFDFNNTYGPVNYSFNRGDVHFVTLDNIIFSNSSSYSGGFTDEQVEWLKQDLSFVPKDKMIILSYHIPLRDHAAYQNRAEILQLLNGYKEVHLMVGHTHYTENFMIKSPIQVYEHIHAAACGAWWRSTINRDGAPNGYGVYHISGATIKEWYYKSVNYDKDFQIRLHKGDVAFGGSYDYFSFNQGENSIIANIWNADDNWKVEAYENGKKVKDLVALDKKMEDAWSLGYHIGVVGRNPASYRSAAKHLYLHKMIDPDAKIEIRATDRFGNVYKQTQIVDDHTTAESYK